MVDRGEVAFLDIVARARLADAAEDVDAEPLDGVARPATAVDLQFQRLLGGQHAAVLPGARLVTLYQVHSPTCVTVREPWVHEERPRADALVTDSPGLLLGVLTADCAPVLLADREAGVIGAAHAGWKGALGGVIAATIEAMSALGARPERIGAAIGPCVAQASYEVDAAFHERFLAADDAVLTGAG